MRHEYGLKNEAKDFFVNNEFAWEVDSMHLVKSDLVQQAFLKSPPTSTKTLRRPSIAIAIDSHMTEKYRFECFHSFS